MDKKKKTLAEALLLHTNGVNQQGRKMQIQHQDACMHVSHTELQTPKTRPASADASMVLINSV